MTCFALKKRIVSSQCSALLVGVAMLLSGLAADPAQAARRKDGKPVEVSQRAKKAAAPARGVDKKRQVRKGVSRAALRRGAVAGAAATAVAVAPRLSYGQASGLPVLGEGGLEELENQRVEQLEDQAEHEQQG